MIHDDILTDLRRPNPSSGQAWQELLDMATASPEAAIDLVLDLAKRDLEPVKVGWLTIGPLRTALGSANEIEEEQLEERAASDRVLSAMLDALIRYEKKQLAAAERLEGKTPEISADPGPHEIVIPNVHDRSAEQSLDQEAWTKIVKAVEAAPEGQIFMLASTILETLLLQNETAFSRAILEQTGRDPKFRKALSYCELSFSEPFLDELLASLERPS